MNEIQPSIELLAPAGNWECARAAVENGADAIYFGLDVGFNARARAANFHVSDLPKLVHMLHRQAVRGYVTLNTLVFTDEFPELQQNLRQLADAGVDAVLVQDLGVARLIRELCPDLVVHASTQMTLTNAAAIEMAAELGVQRVVLARELSLREIGQISAATDMPLEVFVHGALCVAYSGQCLTSESFGGRSANRGQCAQACRLPYDLLCDGQLRDLGDVKYLLSPQDLAAYELIPELMEAGVCSLKIEGRLKTPEYVANVCQHYRTAIDAAVQRQPRSWSDEERRSLELSFSRGFSPGWLEGCDHKRLVPGRSSAKRGILLGKLLSVRGDTLTAELSAPVSTGDGIVLQGDRFHGQEVGGRVYELFQNGKSVSQSVPGTVEIGLQRGILEGKNLAAGLEIWKTDDPKLTKRLRKTFENADPNKRVPVDLYVRAAVGSVVEIRAKVSDAEELLILSDHVCEAARKHTLDLNTLREQFSRLGGTVYELRELTADIAGGPMVPLSVLGSLRRTLVEQLDANRTTQPLAAAAEDVATRMLSQVRTKWQSDAQRETSNGYTPPGNLVDAPRLYVLCRSLMQLQFALEAQARHVIADFHDIREYSRAVEQAHAAGATIELSTLRIHKPGEDGLFRALKKQAADGWLVRNLAAIRFCKDHQIPFACDFSMNVTNPLTAEQLKNWGATRVTPAYDLNRDQLVELTEHLPADWLEVVVHQHMPMFHMEHCVFCSVLSPGKNKSDCGRPCDRHDVKLRDRVGAEHVLHADIGCRNTLYNATPQSGAEAVPALRELGVKNFRVELLRDTPLEQVRELIELYRRLIAGELKGVEVWQRLKADNRVGVTRGTLEQPRNPLAIL